MKYCLWLFVLTAVAVAATACRNGMKQEASTQLGNGQRGGYRTAFAPDAADNSRCHVCHINYDEEELELNHELVGVSCEKCHGSSDTSSYSTVGQNNRETFRGGRVKIFESFFSLPF